MSPTRTLFLLALLSTGCPSPTSTDLPTQPTPEMDADTDTDTDTDSDTDTDTDTDVDTDPVDTDTDPIDPNDFDGDGLSNDLEAAGWTLSLDQLGLGNPVSVTVFSDPWLADTDGDGLTDLEEFQRTNPAAIDTDGDLLTDPEELMLYLSIPTSVDSDGDSRSGVLSNPQLWDGEEILRWGTSPTLDDTDGDARSDFEEIISNGTNPLIAQTPRVLIRPIGPIDVRLNLEFSSTEVSSQEYAVVMGTTEESTVGESDETIEEESHESTTAISVTIESGLPPGVSGSVSSSSSDKYSSTNTLTTTQAAKQSARNEYQEQVTDAQQYGETAASGELSMGMIIENPSDVAYTLTNIGVTVRLWDARAGEYRTVGTLEPQLEDFNLGAGEQRTVANQISAHTVNADLIKEMLRNPSGLRFDVANFDLENEDGMNFVFLDATTNQRTGRVVIDYGDGTTEDYRVATNIRRNLDGTPAGVTLAEIFDSYLDIPFETQPWVGDGVSFPLREGVETLTAVRGLETTTTDGLGFWAVFSDIANIEAADVDFGDITLNRGEEIHIGYLRDRDEDGIFDAEERFRGTSDELVDSDGDLLSDFDEVKVGWLVDTTPSVDGYPRTVFADPTDIDADGDGLDDLVEQQMGTDPLRADTDADGVDDDVDEFPLSGVNQPPEIDLVVTVDDGLVTLTGSVTDILDWIPSVEIDWGDGTVDSVQSYPEISNDFDAFDPAWTYDFPGTYTITVTATDRVGETTVETLTAEVRIRDTAHHFQFENDFLDRRDQRVAIAYMNGNPLGFQEGRSPNTRAFFFPDARFATDDQVPYTFIQPLVNALRVPIDGDLDEAFSISLWTDGEGVALSQPGFVRIEDTGSNYRVTFGGEVFESSGQHYETGWNLFAFASRANGVVGLFINGAFDSGHVINPSYPNQPCNRMTIGGALTNCEGPPTSGDFTGNNPFFAGRIDDVRIWRQVIDAQDMSGLYEEHGWVR